MARALAGEAGVPFLSVTGSDFMELYVGVGAARVRELFAAARRVAPCIVFIDEIDAVGRQRGSGVGADERDQTLNQLLSELDGFDSDTEVIVLAATNRVDVLDDALLRPGRFDRQVLVPLPEIGERIAILRTHLGERRVAPGVSVDDLARATPGMSGADLANLVNEAALHAIRRGAAAVAQEDLEAARDRVVLGIARDAVVLGPEERRAIATHEAGHAVAATLLAHADPVDRVTILPRGRTLGATLHTGATAGHTLRREELLDRVCVALGGRAAEQLLLGTVTTGAQDDLAVATRLARRMVLEWGMSERFGPRAGEEPVGRGAPPPPLSHELRALADREIDAILRAEAERALEVLRAARAGLERTVERLLVAETLDGDTVRRIVAAPGADVMTG
jgi:cell division protease FtsH